MDDEGGDWFTDAGDEAPAQTEAASAAAPPAAGAGDEAPAGEAEGAAEGAAPAQDTREVAEDEYLDPDKLLLFKHWIR